MKFKVPIQNIYAMLCYCYDLPELVQAVVSKNNELPNESILEKLFLKSLKELLKYDLIKKYKKNNKVTYNIQGKILFNESLNSIMNKKPYLICETDELTKNILPNQIIKSTLWEVSNSALCSKETKKEAYNLLNKFSTVSNIKISRKDFYKVGVQRNNQYQRVLNIAKLLFELKLLTDEIGKIHAYEVINDDRKMQKIFEVFLLNFYKYEQSLYQVKSEILRWPANNQGSLLPIMKTDISLLANDKKIIIDAKYYSEVLTGYYNQNRIRSSHLYQLFSYLNHSDKNIVSRGVLIYPLNNFYVNEKYDLPIQVGSQLMESSISILTIDLSQNWYQIHQDLLNIIQ